MIIDKVGVPKLEIDDLKSRLYICDKAHLPKFDCETFVRCSVNSDSIGKCTSNLTGYLSSVVPRLRTMTPSITINDLTPSIIINNLKLSITTLSIRCRYAECHYEGCRVSLL
jgi:hypothetical protein